MHKLPIALLAALIGCTQACWAASPHMNEETNLFEMIGQAQSSGNISKQDADQYRKRLANLEEREKSLLKSGRMTEKQQRSFSEELHKMQLSLRSQISDSVIEPNLQSEAAFERKISRSQAKGLIDFQTAGRYLSALNKLRADEGQLMNAGKLDKAQKASIAQQLQQLEKKFDTEVAASSAQAQHAPR